MGLYVVWLKLYFVEKVPVDNLSMEVQQTLMAIVPDVQQDQLADAGILWEEKLDSVQEQGAHWMDPKDYCSVLLSVPECLWKEMAWVRQTQMLVY
jgi:hypothetical protein